MGVQLREMFMRGSSTGWGSHEFRVGRAVQERRQHVQPKGFHCGTKEEDEGLAGSLFDQMSPR